ncbi:MAG: GNAT family N-acetyltransferase [Pyrinomonadaceae bacterium]|nr:GNAT family N-acetyltransferase [Pyrinomonadaceae bacterium]
MTSSSKLRIEPASEKDVPLLLTLIRGLAEYEGFLESVTATEERLRASLFGERPYAEAIIAYDNDQPVGYAIYFFTYSSFQGLPGFYLEDLFVLPDSRGAGIGRYLLAFLAKKAIEWGCCRIEWAVLNWNEPAIKFYRKLGAEPMNEWAVFRLSENKLEELAREA